MSALGQKRTFAVQKGMSALPPKADMCSATRHVRFVPIADIRLACVSKLIVLDRSCDKIWGLVVNLHASERCYGRRLRMTHPVQLRRSPLV